MVDLSSLNPEQKKAVTHGTGPLLLIAGAGTGKTTVITKRIEHLILTEKVPPSHILALTFTEKAAAEMETRIDQILPYGYSSLWIETFHAFCDRLLRQEAIHIGLNPSYDLMTEAESLLFLRKNLFQFDLDYFRPLGNPMKFLQGMLSHFSRIKDDDITPEQYADYAEKLKKDKTQDAEEVKKTLELAHAFLTYEKLKAQNGVMDFSDLISNTLKLFRTRPNILKNYQSLFEYILVDEFQDTNYAQNEMAILLAGNNQNITVVGDDDQSIYRWRGAALANMMQFRSHFPKAEVIALTKNYRSTQTILDGAYQLIQYNNPDRLEIKEGINKRLEAFRTDIGEPVEFMYTNRVEDEAEEVAKIIKDEVKKNKRQFNDFAILVRANDHAGPFQKALERAKIPYQFLGPGHLFQQEEIKDLICYMKVLANFDDASALYRVLTLPIFGIEARDIASVLNFAKRNNLSLFEALEQADNSAAGIQAKDRMKKLVTMIKKHLEKVPHEDAGQILYSFFEDSGLLGYYLDPKSARTEREALNVAKFFDKLSSFSANREDASVFAVVDWIDLSMELGESPLAAEVDFTANNAVNILTVHSSKGLEFPVVFVVNLVTQRFPSRDRKEQIPVPQDLIREELPQGDESIQEERRLFYVAMTRARDRLFLTASKWYGEAKRERKLSPFVNEALGEQIVSGIMDQQKYTDPGQQLSLLDMFNVHLANQAEPQIASKSIVQMLQPLTYISYSQIQTFDSCPLHYKLRYVLNVPTPASPALSYGISVHSTLRDFFQYVKADQKPTPTLMHDILTKNWIKVGYAGKTHEQKAFQQADGMLTAFAAATLANRPDTLAIEMPFQFWLDKLKVGGRIDRVDRLPDGRIEIIDYKTGSNVPDAKKVKDDFQLSFYALAATEIKDGILTDVDPDKIVLSLYYIEQDKKISTVRTKDDLEFAKEKILTKVDEITKSEFLCNGNMFCKSCEYKLVCQTIAN